MDKKLMLIVNPAAGRSGYKYNFAEAMNALAAGGYQTTLFFTKQAKDATNIAAENAEDYDYAVCIGGDGTLSEVMAGLIRCEKRPLLGYIPMGTANDVATTLGLPKNDCLAAVRRFMDGEAHPFDLGGFGDNETFAYIAAFGAFTEVSYATPQTQKKALGHLAYVLQGMASLPSIESVQTRVEYDGGVVDGKLLYGSMSNSTSVAGIVRLPEEMVCLGDGESELVLVREPEYITGFHEILDSVLSQRFDSKNLLILHTKRAKFTFEKPVAWTRDGENGGMHQCVELRNYHAPISMVF